MWKSSAVERPFARELRELNGAALNWGMDGEAQLSLFEESCAGALTLSVDGFATLWLLLSPRAPPLAPRPPSTPKLTRPRPGPSPLMRSWKGFPVLKRVAEFQASDGEPPTRAPLHARVSARAHATRTPRPRPHPPPFRGASRRGLPTSLLPQLRLTPPRAARSGVRAGLAAQLAFPLGQFFASPLAAASRQQRKPAGQPPGTAADNATVTRVFELEAEVDHLRKALGDAKNDRRV